MTTFLIAGYQATELGIFNDKDPKLKVIKKAIRRYLIRLLEDGVDWLLFRGHLGFEYWVLEVAQELRQEGYDFQLATVFCFASHGQQWNENNQIKISRFKQVDFVKYCYEDYENPSQLREYQRFLLENSQGIFLFYEPDYETKLAYLYDAVRDREGYDLVRLTYEMLEEIALEEE